ncbi:unnamed protein product [Cyprideis torosa]|uniref:non-specific serine/threonine protein kinase n=1 Tax=Cyprideis torosa TaxID=163714 RepID=A0A7R8WR06_9CRUS|nr:unnamed protein product [Cyprideis torosa]CAG0908372.1 unnamed protein product [Cyprideis torosa]
MYTGGRFVFHDASQDEDLFTGEGDPQFDVYRDMRKCNDDNWRSYHPETNVMWIQFLLGKVLKDVGYKKCSGAEHRAVFEHVKEMQKVAQKSFILKSVTSSIKSNLRCVTFVVSKCEWLARYGRHWPIAFPVRTLTTSSSPLLSSSMVSKAVVLEGSSLEPGQLVEVTGPPGAGKTNFALRLALSLAKSKAVRVLIVDAESVVSRERLVCL